MSQKFPFNNTERIKFNNLMKISHKTTMKQVMKDILLKLIFNILKNYMNFIMIYHFYLRGLRLKMSKGL